MSHFKRSFLVHFRLSLAILLIVIGLLLSTNPVVLALVGGRLLGGGPQSNAGFAVRQPASVNNGLVAYYPLDGNANDVSGNGNNGTLTNFMNDGLDGFTTGKFGQGLLYNRSRNNYLSTPSPVTSAIDNFSISAWVYPNNFGQSGSAKTIVSNGNTSFGTGWGMYIGDINFNFGAKLMGDYRGVAYLDSGYSFPSTNRWYNVVMERLSGITYFYVNGQQTPNTFTNTPSAPTGHTNIGELYNQTSGTFSGSLDDVRIYNRAISAAEVTTLYQGSSPEQCDQSCVGYWKLDEASGMTAKSSVSTANGNDGTLVNSPTWTAGQYGNALSFNGSTTKVTASPTFPTTTGSVSMYVNPNSVASTAGGTTLFSENANAFGLFYNSTSNASTNLDFWGGANDTAGSAKPTVGSWNHIVITWNATTKQIYLNNSLIGSSTGTFTYAFTNPLNIAGQWVVNAAITGFNGSIDDFRVYNSVLSGADVSSLYTSNTSSVDATNLSAYWKFDASSGTTAVDSSVTTPTGTLNNFTFNGTTNGWTSGVFGNGLLFNGSNNYISVPYNSAQNTSQFSTSVWVNVKGGAGGHRAIISARSCSSGFTLYIDPTDHWEFYKGCGLLFNSTSTVSYNTWYHAVFLYDGSAFKLYVNGSLLTSVTTSYTPNTANELRIGAGRNETNPLLFFNGALDDVRIYNWALSANEVYNQYAAGR